MGRSEIPQNCADKTADFLQKICGYSHAELVSSAGADQTMDSIKKGRIIGMLKQVQHDIALYFSLFTFYSPPIW
jgi:hypothetical protein